MIMRNFLFSLARIPLNKRKSTQLNLRRLKLHKNIAKFLVIFSLSGESSQSTISEVLTFIVDITRSVMIRRMLVPGSPILAAAVVAKVEESADSKKEKILICKPSSLPIYTPPVDRWLLL